MLDQPAASHHIRLRDHPRLDFQDHLADLEAKGLLVRVDRPINKDTELHRLARSPPHPTSMPSAWAKRLAISARLGCARLPIPSRPWWLTRRGARRSCS